MALQNVKKSVPMKVNKKPVQAKTVKSSGDCILALGRRKVATARVRLYRGKGQCMVNEKSAAEYFKSVDPMGAYFMKPFVLTGTQQTAYVTAKIQGSGIASQEDALIHGIARALVKMDEAHKPVLRKAGLLTRDARMKESRKIGTGGKARRVKQSPKR